MKAVILCAGSGTRLLPYTETTPKCLVRVAGKPILEYQLSALEACGVGDITVVTGYLREQVESFVEGRCRSVCNEQFRTTNSLYSLWLTRKMVEASDLVLINGDVIFDAELLAPLLEDSVETGALVDSTVALQQGEMNVVIEGGRVVEFSKQIDVDRADALSLQITKFGQDDAGRLFARINELVEAGDVNKFPASAYDVVISQSRMVPVERTGGIWFEIDTVEDLENCERALREQNPAASDVRE